MVQALNTALRRVPPLAIYIAGALPFLWLVWLAVNGGLGADPVKALEHQLGKWGLQLMIAVLLVTPLRRFTGLNLIRYRRALGLLAFFYIALHLTVWVSLDLQFRWAEIWADIVKRPYITAGMAGFVAMIPLAITSNTFSIRRLGPKTWQNLHRLTYFAGLAGAVHYLWLVKAWPPEPIIYLILMIFLLTIRMISRLGR
ncbi:protein-methionine-sulfoxide reductase heme-binding subunit MsrQ [Pseudorhodobacter sp. W20_MBD10_FR17]|uniref:protein-methionine-sulfoxide reductase heme-binding subunit MsrQ n=1 Tax=Pseudorhodobacter sp. W20_MBD10_FR17 TaxID=3240266 RepID=UPI003F98EA53